MIGRIITNFENELEKVEVAINNIGMSTHVLYFLLKDSRLSSVSNRIFFSPIIFLVAYVGRHQPSTMTTSNDDGNECLQPAPENLETLTEDDGPFSDCNLPDASAHSTVSFGEVRVVEHSVVLGDNPGVSRGLPVRLGSYLFSKRFDVEDFEKKREERGSKKAAPRLTKEERDRIVQDKHRRASIVTARKTVKDIQLSRYYTKEEDKKLLRKQKQGDNGEKKKSFFFRIFRKKTS